MPPDGDIFREDASVADVSLWRELRFGADLFSLLLSRAFYGLGLPRGDRSAVILLPGFLMPDFYLVVMRNWLRRMGYKAYFSGIRVNADCPNLLIQNYINHTIDKARRETGRKVHLIGHSLGGIIARSIAGQRPKDVGSVITLGSPFRGATAHRAVLLAARAVRWRVHRKHATDVLEDCYTGHCRCDFVNVLRRDLPPSILQTAVYTRRDGVVDWTFCVTGNRDIDFEVSATHIGLAFHPQVYSLMAYRLKAASTPEAASCALPISG